MSADAASPSPTEEATPEPASEEPVASEDPGATTGAIPSFGLGDLTCDNSPLADVLPDTIGGQQIQTVCMEGDQFVQAGSADPAFQEFLDSVDAEASDISVAFGGSLDGSVGVVAFRVAGVAEDDLEENFLAANEAQGEIANVEQTNIGGKDVWTAASTDPSAPGSAYIYVNDDVVFFLTGDEAQATEVLEALP